MRSLLWALLSQSATSVWSPCLFSFIPQATSVSSFFYRRERPAEFSPPLHFLFPLLSTLSLMWVAYKSIVPLPDAPIRYAPFLVGTWLFGGVVVLLTVPRASRDALEQREEIEL
jgi:hypothetical protein